MDREEITACLASLREDMDRTAAMMPSDLQRDTRLEHIESALIVLMVALLSHPSTN